MLKPTNLLEIELEKHESNRSNGNDGNICISEGINDLESGEDISTKL